MAPDKKQLRYYPTQIARQAIVPAGSNDLIACALAAASVRQRPSKAVSSANVPQTSAAPAGQRRRLREHILRLLRTSMRRLRLSKLA